MSTVPLELRRDDFSAFVGALFAPTDRVQIECYPKPNPGKGPAVLRPAVAVRGRPFGLARFCCQAQYVEEYVAAIETANNGPVWGNAYIRVNPLRSDFSGERSAGETDVCVSRCLWLDFDDLIPIQLRARVAELGWPEPHMIVSSGGAERKGVGCHGYWLLSSAWPLESGEQRERFKSVLSMMVAVGRADRGAKGLNRLMRLPGSYNVKEPDQHTPKRCMLSEIDLARPRWDLAAWAEKLEEQGSSVRGVEGASEGETRAAADAAAPRAAPAVLDDAARGCGWLRSAVAKPDELDAAGRTALAACVLHTKDGEPRARALGLTDADLTAARGFLPLTDALVIGLAREKNADFAGLFDRGEVSDSHSEADLKLCGLLAFWCAGDAGQIDRLFRRSKLIRDKWDSKRGPRTYGGQTIDKALAGGTKRYAEGAPSCRRIAELAGATCSACRYWERIPSPLVLGRPRETARDQKADLGDGKMRLARLVKRCAAAEDRAAAADCIHETLADERTLAELATVYRHELGIFTGQMGRLAAARYVTKTAVEEIKSVVRAQVEAGQRAEKSAARREQAEGVPVRQSLGDAPVPESLLVPPKWALNHEGVWSVKTNREGVTYPELVSVTPLVISGRLIDLDTHNMALAIAWKKRGRWHTRIVDREALALAQEVIRALAAPGADVTSANKIHVIRWLAMFEGVNSDVLPSIDATAHAGWVPGKRFLLGNCYVDADGAHELAGDDPSGWEDGAVAFRLPGEGEADLLSGYVTGGTYEGWIKAVEPLAEFPRAQVAIYAALAAPLLRLLRCPPMIVEFAHESSTGKTTALQVGASTCGVANERAPNSIIRPWFATQVSVERSLALLQNLPLCLDDTRKNAKPETLPQIVYMISGGQGKGRGTVSGLAGAGTWSTTVLSTGERKIVDYGSEQGGTHGRALCLWGSPFGEKSERVAAIVDELKLGLEEHYGHALPRLVQFILRSEERWAEWREQHRASQREYLAAYREAAGTGAEHVAHRIGGYVAALQMTAAIVHEALPELPWDAPDLWEVLAPAILEGVEGADRATIALRAVLDDVVRNPSRYVDMTHGAGGKENEPVGGWRGRWDHIAWSASRTETQYIGVLRAVAEEVLDRAGMAASEVVKTWRERGWLRQEKTNRSTTYPIDMPRGKPRMYAILRTTVEELSGGSWIADPAAVHQQQAFGDADGDNGEDAPF